MQAAHIVADPSPEGIAAVVNGLALCAIHHLAYDRDLLGIDPAGGVHIARASATSTTGRCCAKVFRVSTVHAIREAAAAKRSIRTPIV